jgi:hypothetical protein
VDDQREQILENIKHAKSLKKQEEQRRKRKQREAEQQARRAGPFNGSKE